MANGNPDASTITFDVCLCDDTVTLDGTALTISSDVTIDGDVDGDNRADIAIDANGSSRVFHVTGGIATLDALIISGGYADLQRRRCQDRERGRPHDRQCGCDRQLRGLLSAASTMPAR